MTPAASLLQPDSNPALYASPYSRFTSICRIPLCARALQDQRLAHRLLDNGVSPCTSSRPLCSLASLRRLIRPSRCATDCPRSARLPISDPSSRNSSAHPAPDGYLDYLRLKLRAHADNSRSGECPKIYVFR